MTSQRDIMQLQPAECMPMIDEIQDGSLRSLVEDMWLDMFSWSGWDDVRSCPFVKLAAAEVYSLTQHSNNVAIVAASIGVTLAERRDPPVRPDIDLLIAGSILHDVSKLVETTMVDGKVETSALGWNAPHASASLASLARRGASPVLLNIVAAHTPATNASIRSYEASIVGHADYIDGDGFASLHKMPYFSQIARKGASALGRAVSGLPKQ